MITTTVHQIFCKVILNSQNLVKSNLNPEMSFLKMSEAGMGDVESTFVQNTISQKYLIII